jgi:uncharacterized membrane-anchored protein YitT (DUF2179 family)
MKVFNVNPLQEVKDYALITIGLMLYTVGFVYFQLPYQITTGGTTGAGAVIYYACGFPVQYTYLIVNVILLSVAIKVLGIRFCLKTIYAVGVLTLLLGVAQQHFMRPDGHFPQLLGEQKFMACIIGAGLEGIGIAMVFLNNGSTGGNDIIAAIIHKYRDVTMGQVMMLCDIIIISSSFFVFRNWEPLLYGYSSLIISNLLLDYVMDRARQSVQFLIISKEYDDIAREIAATHRGVTVLDGHGWYTGQDQKVLMVLAKKRESTNIFRMIKHIDPNAFVSQSKAIGVFGEGFDKIKVK